MEFVFLLIMAALILFGLGYFLRKNIYKKIDELEAHKIELMNRSIVEEMSKVKDLKMTGQTEELFERWRSDWDEILTTQLPKVEELLFDAEEFTDKFRFKKANQVLDHVEMMLQQTSQNIDSILQEIHNLVTSEKQNRVEIEELREKFKKAKKMLLAHSHVYGKAHEKLEAMNHEIFEALKSFDSEMEEGNYLAAREILVVQQEQLDELLDKLDEIPRLLNECKTLIPNQLDELTSGYDEMINQGYQLDHIQVIQEIDKLRKTADNCLVQIEKTEIKDIGPVIHDLNEAIETIYDLLEKEVLSSQYVLETKNKVDLLIEQLSEQKRETKDETELVKQSYHLSEKETEKQRTIEIRISAIEKQFSQLKENLQTDQVAYTLIKEELIEIEKQILEIQSDHNNYKEMLETLRKEEMEARQKLTVLKQEVAEATRMVHKSNVPGLPHNFSDIFSEAKLSIIRVTEKLDEVPLNMLAVNDGLEDAVHIVGKMKKYTEEMVEQVYMIERLIQYGNRYRSKYPQIGLQLNEAEYLFRKYEYQKSLELVASAVEQVEPGTSEKIKHHVDNEINRLAK
ncbi:septation ring formation regulator EzrA [Metabacillus arenae]|uniref:Septation ring formation regulator EzrA n=1 Tax=Metabacillus arenae TaxID=2771434 RepID=A0A926NLR5_9BACI|nr:septation ring formation regulator EzrA [Metabacillus arenae]MBD1380136.1 septation ring formation regulator EzrA [Metabacillus arenae]